VGGRIAAAVFLAAILGTLAAGAFMPPEWQRAVEHDGPGCPFRSATGVNCPFCGMTRATVALGRGDVHGALGFHPLAPLVLAFLAALMTIVVIGRTDLLVRGKRPWILLGAVGAIWAARLLLD
jgi:hypothetical protein